jgi:hypothetical protein
VRNMFGVIASLKRGLLERKCSQWTKMGRLAKSRARRISD